MENIKNKRGKGYLREECVWSRDMYQLRRGFIKGSLDARAGLNS